MKTAFSWKIIDNDVELDEYSRRFASRPGLIPLEKTWLKNNHVVAIYYRGKMQAGFVHETFPYSRSLFELKEEDRLSLLLSSCEGDVSGVLSLGCFWIDKKTTTHWLTPYTWIVMWAYLVKRKRSLRYIMFASNNNKLHSIYSQIGCTEIYNEESITNIANRSIIYLDKATWFNGARFAAFIAKWSLSRGLNNMKLKYFGHGGKDLGSGFNIKISDVNENR
jgi:hypothetical protein